MNSFAELVNPLKKHFLGRTESVLQARVCQANRTRIAIVSDRVYPYFKGGAEKRYWEIATSLRDAGYEIHFYTGRWPGMPKHSVVDGISLHGVYSVGAFYVNGHKSITESLKYTLSVLPYLLSEEYDLIECEQFPLLPIFASKIAAIVRGKPLVVTWHEVWGKELWIRYLGPLGRIGAWIESISVHLPDHVISVSEQTTRNLSQRYKVAEAKISTIPNGINSHWDRRGSAAAESGLGSDTPSPSMPVGIAITAAHSDRRAATESSDLIFVGRLARHKNVDLLLKVVAFIKQSHADIKCLIIGDGPERKNLEEMSKKLGTERNVRFLGRVENDRQVYSLITFSKAFFLPSVREGFGIAVLEANACGVPALVIADKDNAACDLVKEGHNGYICHLDSREVGQRVMQILDAPVHMYLESCHEVSDGFNWGRVGKRVDKIYQSMLAGGEA